MIEPPGRNLTRAELRAVVTALGAQPGDCAARVRRDPAERVYEELHHEVHAYSPPLRSMRSYVVEDTGDLRRLPLSGSDELRPLSA